MLRRFLLVAVVVSASLLPAAAVADLGRMRLAQSDEAPGPVQDLDPSRAEPMMLGPTPEEDAERYRRDLAACERQSSEEREACLTAVDREYRPEVTNLPAGCDALDGQAKLACLQTNDPEG